MRKTKLSSSSNPNSSTKKRTIQLVAHGALKIDTTAAKYPIRTVPPLASNRVQRTPSSVITVLGCPLSMSLKRSPTVSACQPASKEQAQLTNTTWRGEQMQKSHRPRASRWRLTTKQPCVLVAYQEAATSITACVCHLGIKPRRPPSTNNKIVLECPNLQ